MNKRWIFVDANALADLFVGESNPREDAVRLRRKFPDWVTLPLCRYEFGNVLRRYTRSGKIPPDAAVLMLRRGLSMVTFCAECEDEIVFAEAEASNLSFYDAAYVARARSLGRRLHTRDSGILENCPEIACRIADA